MNKLQKNVFVINGPNINLLGKREPSIYGKTSLAEIEDAMQQLADRYNMQISFYQSNHEGEIIDYLQSLNAGSYIIINPAGLTHTSVSIRDCIAAIECTTIEVHISNIAAREEFRSKSLISAVCKGTISGLGASGYNFALNWIKDN